LRAGILGTLVVGAGAMAALALAVDAPVTFTDVTAAAGIRFKHNSGAFGK
jgi:hypothetical protein